MSARAYSTASREAVDELRSLVEGEVVVPGDADYEAAIHRWSAGTIRKAGIVCRAAGPGDVQAAVRWATKHNVEIAVKGGGLSPIGASSTTGGIVIDLGRLNSVHVDKKAMTITCGGGTIWEKVRGSHIGLAEPVKVYAALDEAQLTCAGGGYWCVEVSLCSLTAQGRRRGRLLARCGLLVDERSLRPGRGQCHRGDDCARRRDDQALLGLRGARALLRDPRHLVQLRRALGQSPVPI